MTSFKSDQRERLKTVRGESGFSEKSVSCVKLYIVVDDYPFVLYYI